MADQGEMECREEDLSPDIYNWSKHQVRQWALRLDCVDGKVAEILFNQDIDGPSLLLLDKTDLTRIGVKYGPAILLIYARDEVLKSKKEEPVGSRNQLGKPCKPYPFCRYHDTFRYMESSFLDVTESGASDLIEPCHEYKAFTSTTGETKMNKFTSEVIQFAAACMNSRTNGTIHFGIGDKPNFTHGQVLGVVVENREAFANKLKSAIDKCFKNGQKQAAQTCIKPPRFVGVLNKNMTSSDKCVIEVDVVPESTICKENSYHADTIKKGKKKGKTKGTESEPSKCFFIRDGGSSTDLLAQPKKQQYEQFLESVAERSERRKKAEEKHLSVIKKSSHGSRLSHMISGGSLSLDKSNVAQYVIVTNKSHPCQSDSLKFLVDLNPVAVLDFDPQSATQGLEQYFEQQSTVNCHLPAQYKITEGVESIANKLELTQNTSWVFCNGGIKNEPPSDIDQWLMDKGASVRDVISFLCRKEILPNRRFLVIFLILSRVSEKMDPLVETFITFWQELRGTEQTLCICDNDKAFNSWRDLIQARCGLDISDRCIYDLSFAEVNGTILSLWSENRRSSRFLPCGGGSRVLFEKRVERSLKTLDILCVNQCEGGNEDKTTIEENFYRGGKVTWWNFYFSEQPESTSFIKRHHFDYIKDTIVDDLCSQSKACVLFNLMHVPGCGGTTLAMHILWSLRNTFRCAVLRSSNADFADVADQVVKLLMYKHEEQLPSVPVLLMIDDFNDKEKVDDLQQLIEKECEQKKIQSKSAQVILLNCMRSESFELTRRTVDTVFIGNNLSDKEKEMFEGKFLEIEKTHKNTETFYGFMVMKTNFDATYIEKVVHNTLKSFSINQKNSQLLAVLVLLGAYCPGASLSVSLCEEFLDFQPKPFCGSIDVESQFGKFSAFIATCPVKGEVEFEAVKISLSIIAKQCLVELKATYDVKKHEIAHILLTRDRFYESTQGKSKLLQDLKDILVKRNHKLEESHFSPFIQGIASETPGMEETVLKNASKRYEKDPIVSQLLARYYYLKQKDFAEAKLWAQKAKDLYKDSSHIADTSAQILKHELKNAIADCKEEPISPEKLKALLKLAQSALEAFQETQNLAKKESLQRLQVKTDNRSFNTSGYLGEIQVSMNVTEVLAKTPMFSFDHDLLDTMSQVLSGDLKLSKVESKDPDHNSNKPYYVNLKQFEDVLYNLKCRMKKNLDFLENFYVNLGSRVGLKDSREPVSQNELLKCFRHYANCFCNTASASLSNIHANLELHQMRQFLEKKHGDTYSGILNYLSSDTSTEIIEDIARSYHFIFQHNPTPKEKINFIYLNVVLSRLKLESQLLQPYENMVGLLPQVLHAQMLPSSEILPLHFIAVLLLWPYTDKRVDRNLRRSIELMKTSYDAEMREVYNGKRPVIHFLLGKKRGYERLVHIEEIKKCIVDGQQQFASMWGSGKIWKEKKVEELLYRVTGEVKDGHIMTYAGISVTPMYRSQISGYAHGSKVSFFIGFSMKGPLAFDIRKNYN